MMSSDQDFGNGTQSLEAMQGITDAQCASARRSVHYDAFDAHPLLAMGLAEDGAENAESCILRGCPESYMNETTLTTKMLETNYLSPDEATAIKYTERTPRTSSSPPQGIVPMGIGHRQVKGLSPLQYQENVAGDSEELKEKKKAQNRAAQKAFRERKEAKLRELEQRLRESEENRGALFRELEQLRIENQLINNENRLLLQRSAAHPTSMMPLSLTEKFSFPAKDDNSSTSDRAHDESSTTPFQYYAGGKKLYTVPATWGYLHELSLKKSLDVFYIMQLLKGSEVCHGHGPAYTRELIDSLVNEYWKHRGNEQ